jgi:hypothetical protein
MTPTPTERRACAIARAERALAFLLQAMAYAGTYAELHAATTAYAWESARLDGLRRSEP